MEQLWAEKREKERRIAHLELELDQARMCISWRRFQMSSFILADFFDLELFLLGKKHDGQPGGGYEARNQV